jgi:hypothetical protein
MFADTLSVTMFVFGVIVIEVWETDLPVWGFVLALLICAFVSSFVIVRFHPEFHIHYVLAFVYTLPLSMMRATTSQLPGLNVITELIIGYALPGRPTAMMLFKTWGYMTMIQATTFISDFKLAHYMKIPHRPMFFCQVVATIVAGTVQLGVQAWMFSNIEGLCEADQKDGFICPGTIVFGNASIIVSKLVVLAHTFCIPWLKDVALQWGVIGPRRLFSYGQLYYGLVFFFLAGILAPLFQWILHKKFRIGFLKYINLPVALGSMAEMPPATPLNYVPGVFICFIFNYIIRRRHFDWWAKYNCESLRDEAIGRFYFF